MMELQGKKVLVVDDRPELSSAMASACTKAGATVAVANTFEAGLASARENIPDIALVDIDLGTGSGIDLIKTIQADPGPHPFFAILTNSTSMEHVAQALDLNVIMFIQKAEHDPPEIVQMVSRQYAHHHEKGNLVPGQVVQ